MKKFDSGIYRICNTVTGDCYVGRAKDLAQRERGHFTALAAHTHPNPLLQTSFDAHGREAFTFDVLERTPTPYNGDREMHWILRYRPALNQAVPYIKRPRQRGRRPVERPVAHCPFRTIVLQVMSEQGLSSYALVKLLQGRRPGGKDVPAPTVYQWLRGDNGFNSADLWLVLEALNLKVQAAI